MIINVNGAGAAGVVVNGGTFIGTQNNFFIFIGGDTRVAVNQVSAALAASAPQPLFIRSRR